MLSPNTPSSGSPITTLPYDILQEIFTHCFPLYPLRRQQPSTTSAPRLLCHICSSWRQLALASPTLWTHLSCFLTVVEYNDDWDSASWTIGFIERDIEFIRWWRKNHGQIPPFLILDVEKRNCDDITQKLTGDSTPFLLEYLSSAQYLQLDSFYWELILQNIEAGYPIVFRNLHTVLTEDAYIENAFHKFQTLLPHTLPALRRLSINNFADLHHWTLLTHLSLYVSLSFKFWFIMIRAIPHLRWGYFDIFFITAPSDTNTPPPQCTLPDLTTLTLAVRHELERDSVFPLSSLFVALHLPALRTLSLSSHGASAWEDARALREVYSVLRSAPAVTKLVLEDDTLSLDTHTPLFISPLMTDIVPIWYHSPELVHLQLALSPEVKRNKSQREEVLAHFVRYVFSPDNVWLDLRNPASPICAVTIGNNDPLHLISELTMASIRESAAKVPKVVLDITSESTHRVAANVREEWGSRI